MSKVTEVQLKEWKEKHGGFYELPVEDKVCFLRIPNMLDFRIGFDALSEEGEIAFAEVMFNTLWLGGDRTILTEDTYFNSARKVLKKTLDYKDALFTKGEDSKYTIEIEGKTCVVRTITREDLRRAERANPSNKTFVTQEKLFGIVCIEKDPVFEDKNNAEIRFPLYKVLEELQDTKYATLKKH